MKSLLLIYPPLAKNCEPPPGLARLAGFLCGHGASCATYDANLHGFYYLLGLAPGGSDTWTRRAKKNLAANLAGLRNMATYGNFDRYKRAVADVNRLLSSVGQTQGVELSLANYQDEWSPLRSDHLLQVAEAYEESIFFPFYDEVVPDLLRAKGPEVIGISLSYLSQAVAAFALIGFLRARFPGKKIILGGGLITSWRRSPLWRDQFAGLVDQCLAGPGEGPLLKLLGGERREGVDITPQYDEPDGPGPAGELAKKYLAPGLILPYAAASGCYWNRCLFCPETAEENPYEPLAPERVVAEVASLCERHAPTLIHFLDNAVSPALMQRLVAQPPGVPWYGFARASPLLADVDFCRQLRRSGCVMLKLGLESGDQQVLDAMDKGTRLPMVRQVLAALKAAGIQTYVYLLFGTPAEDEAAARRTMEFTIRHHEEITFLNLAIFNLPLASPEAGGLAKSDFYAGDLSLYSDFAHPLGWSRRRIRAFLAQEFKRHAAIAPIIQRDPPLFTSNHAPLFHPSFSG